MSELAKLIAAGVILLLGKIVWDWLNQKRNGNGYNGNGRSAGAQDPAFWKLEFRAAVRDELIIHDRNPEHLDTYRQIAREGHEDCVRQIQDAVKGLKKR